jgi:hypothetical protein
MQHAGTQTEVQGMPPHHIRAEIIRNQDTIKGLAWRWSSEARIWLREDVSKCINRTAIYPELRAKIAAYLGKSVEEVFGPQSQVKRETLAQANQHSS